MKSTILVIVGPTASGKTSLALQIASHLPQCAIISVDARQAYKDLDILTGKDVPEHLPSGTHIYGLDLFEPEDEINLAAFVSKIDPIIKDNLHSRTPIILVGGSGLYLKALTSELSDLFVPPDPVLRERLAGFSVSQLQQELVKVDPELFNKLNQSDSNNPRRLIRHIEKTVSRSRGGGRILPSADFHWIGLKISKDSLKERIEKRVGERIEEGALQEVERILSTKKISPQLKTSLGIEEITGFLEGKTSKAELISQWTKSEMEYSRRQMVWFNKQPSIIWYDESKDRKALAQELSEFIKTQNEQK